MQKMIVSAMFALCLGLSAQETGREVRHLSAQSNQDPTASTSEVPNGYAVNARLERLLVLRFKYNTDLKAELERMVKQEKIQNAIILSAIGSVRNYQVHQVENRDLPPKDSFVKDAAAPADIIGMSGAVIHGRVHAHITLANREKAFGGHLESGTTVFTFAMMTLGVIADEVDLSKIDDWTYR